jgi:predicted transcriptional regulator
MMQALKTPASPKPVSLKLDAALKARLDAIAVTRDRTPHWLMHSAIESFVEREERHAALMREAEASYEHYVLTGLHISEDRMNEWLDQLAAGQDIDPPECQV